MKYWMSTPATLDTVQYTARPLGKVRVMNPSMMGIIHNIILLVCACLGSADGVMVIFCCSQVEAPTSTGSTILVGSGAARSNHRKSGFSGMATSENGFHE